MPRSSLLKTVSNMNISYNGTDFMYHIKFWWRKPWGMIHKKVMPWPAANARLQRWVTELPMRAFVLDSFRISVYPLNFTYSNIFGIKVCNQNVMINCICDQHMKTNPDLTKSFKANKAQNTCHSSDNWWLSSSLNMLVTDTAT